MSRLPLCRHLRWKARYGSAFPTDEALLDSFLTSGVPFTCNRTCQTWGPDGTLVAPEGCGEGRRCFEPTPGRGLA